jgi:hypothetical protein
MGDNPALAAVAIDGGTSDPPIAVRYFDHRGRLMPADSLSCIVVVDLAAVVRTKLLLALSRKATVNA